MKIVQSFWSCKRDLFNNSFGWYSPQYHVMGWALSCLSLKKFYSDIHLYTDMNGAKMLIDYLELPYKKVHLCYDNINHYNKALWALPKILTYGAQEEPFIHVDGDLFVWEKFKDELENAALIAQNLEIGTGYYKQIMDSIKKDLHYLPRQVKSELNKKSILSYNAGILGGNDISFFKENYIPTALKIIEDNYKGNNKINISINFNILFEQVLFYVLAKQKGKKVVCYFKENYEDNGYTHEKVADFSSVPYQNNYLHLIGPHKRSINTCELMSRILFKEYPEYFYKIVSLFKEDHNRFNTKITPLLSKFSFSNKNNTKKKRIRIPAYSKIIKTSSYGRIRLAILLKEKKCRKLPVKEIKAFVKDSSSMLIKELFEYENQLSKHIFNWNKLSDDTFYKMECLHGPNFDFFYLPKTLQLEKIIEKNSFLKIIETSFEWTTDIRILLYKERNQKSFQKNKINIACVPELFFKGYSETLIDDWTYNILILLERPMTFKNLLRELEACFPTEEITDNYDAIYRLIVFKIKELFYGKCIFIKNNSKDQ